MRYLLSAFIIGLFLIIGCTYDFPPSAAEPDYNLDNIDFESMTILGSSVSAGYMDGALYNAGQNNSYGAHVGSLLEPKLGLNIHAPLLINSENGLNTDINNNNEARGKFYLSFRAPTQNWPARLTKEGEAISDFSGDLSAISNYSTPALKIYQIDDAAVLTGNRYFDRITEKGANQSILDLALNNNPSLFFLEPGTEDIFGYAISGASGDIDPDPSSASYSDLTSESLFEQELNEVVGRIMNESSADLFLLNIPDPFVLPYFTTLSWFYSDEEWDVVAKGEYPPFAIYDSLNIRIQQHNQNVSFNDRRPLIIFDNYGGRTFRAKVIEDEYLIDAIDDEGEEIPKWRQMTNRDYFLYNAEEIHVESLENPPVFGSNSPIPDMYIISRREVDLINDRREYFNSVISNIAINNSRIHLIDFDGLFKDIENQLISYDGVTYSFNFDNRGIISADGITLNARGQALLANEIIKVINDSFGTTIKFVDVNKQRGTEIRNQF